MINDHLNIVQYLTKHYIAIIETKNNKEGTARNHHRKIRVFDTITKGNVLLSILTLQLIRRQCN
jgi:hypothetical protein